VSTPAELNVKLVKSNGIGKELEDKDTVLNLSWEFALRYSYLTWYCKCAVGTVLKFTYSTHTGSLHYSKKKKVLRYLSGTTDLALNIKRIINCLIRCWLGSGLNNKLSVSGYLFVYCVWGWS